MPSSPELDHDICRVCGVEVKAMAYKGEGFCGVVHKKRWEEENPTPMELLVSAPEVVELLSAAGVPNKYRGDVEKEFNALLARKMPHLVRLVDTLGVESN